jgi:hypothetical protein
VHDRILTPSEAIKEEGRDYEGIRIPNSKADEAEWVFPGASLTCLFLQANRLSCSAVVWQVFEALSEMSGRRPPQSYSSIMVCVELLGGIAGPGLQRPQLQFRVQSRSPTELRMASPSLKYLGRMIVDEKVDSPGGSLFSLTSMIRG